MDQCSANEIIFSKFKMYDLFSLINRNERVMKLNIQQNLFIHTSHFNKEDTDLSVLYLDTKQHFIYVPKSDSNKNVLRML